MAKAKPKAKTYKAYAVFNHDGRIVTARNTRRELLVLGWDKSTIEPVTITRTRKEVRK